MWHITITKQQLEAHRACEESLPLWEVLMTDGSWTGPWTPLHACWLAVADGALAQSVGALGWLEQHGLVPSVLRGADLTGADLGGADLTKADLSGADLTGADLTGANFLGARLRYAFLTGAKFRGGSFRGADLVGVNVNGMNLRGVQLGRQHTE